MGGAFALAAITVALVSPAIGFLLDRFPPRRIILPAILGFALALASLSRLTPHIGQFYFTFFVLGLVANGTAQFAYTRTVLTWFSKNRGFALALLLTGSGVGSVVIPPLTQWMIAHHGWRNAFLMLGGIALLGFPLTAMLVRNRPEAVIVRADNRDSGDDGRGRAAHRGLLDPRVHHHLFRVQRKRSGHQPGRHPHPTRNRCLERCRGSLRARRSGNYRQTLHRLRHRSRLPAAHPDFCPPPCGSGHADSCLRRLRSDRLAGRGDSGRRPGQRSRCRPLSARALLRPQTFFGAVRTQLDRVCHRRRHRTSVDRTSVRPRRRLSPAIHRVSCLCGVRCRRSELLPAARCGENHTRARPELQHPPNDFCPLRPIH